MAAGRVTKPRITPSFASLRAPAGEGDGYYKVVMLAGAIGTDTDLAGGAGGGAKIGELAQERRHELQVRGHFELAMFESQLKHGQQVALGHVPGFAGAALPFGASNVDGENIAVEARGAEHIDDGRADAGRVHGESAVAGEFIMLDDFADTIDDAGVRGAEGQAFDMEKLKRVE
jgi:hypothetical protein